MVAGRLRRLHDHGVPCPQTLIELLVHGLAAGREPLALHRLPHLGQYRYATVHALTDEDEVQPVRRLDGSRPAAWLEVLQLRGERVAEEPRNLAVGRQRELGWQQKGITERARVRCSGVRGELREELPGLGVGGGAATVATQIDVLERQTRLDAEGVGMLL
jgi:hypothetical protein